MSTDADVMMRWLTAMRDPDLDVALVASLEVEAERRGWNPLTVLDAMTAARGFSADLHPRGRDGKFIEKLGLVELFDVKGTKPGQRGKVTKITPDPKTPGRPTISVQTTGRDGKPGPTINVKPNNIGQAPEKARLDRFGNTPEISPSGPGLAQPAKPTVPTGAPGDTVADRLRMDVPFGQRSAPPAPPDPAEVRRREQERSARALPDEVLAEQATSPGAPADWRQAVETEQANRAARRAQDEQKRQALIDSINTDAATLSTTDPEERARGLDDILAKLRFSIIDTDKVNDNIYPPGDSGRWTAERNAEHEQMWTELLAQVEASNIPRDHDAFVLGGLPGAGKSYTLRPGQQAAGFGVTAWEPNGPMPDSATHVSVNPDIVKEMMIARGMLPDGISNDLKPMEQVTFLHEESSYIAKIFSKRLGDLGYNVVLDNTMDSEGGMLKRMTPLARQGYKFRGLFVDIPVEESVQSATKRYLDSALTPQGGRFVPSSVQGNRTSTKGNLSKNRDAMDSLVEQDWFTDFMIVDNTGISSRTPKGEIIGQGTGNGSAADKYLPGADKAVPKAGPSLPANPEAPPTIFPPEAEAPAAAAPAAV